MTTAFTDVDTANLMQGFGHLTGSHRRTLAAILRPPLADQNRRRLTLSPLNRFVAPDADQGRAYCAAGIDVVGDAAWWFRDAVAITSTFPMPCRDREFMLLDLGDGSRDDLPMASVRSTPIPATALPCCSDGATRSALS
jgi:hypothetical protein